MDWECEGVEGHVVRGDELIHLAISEFLGDVIKLSDLRISVLTSDEAVPDTAEEVKVFPVLLEVLGKVLGEADVRVAEVVRELLVGLLGLPDEAAFLAAEGVLELLENFSHTFKMFSWLLETPDEAVLLAAEGVDEIFEYIDNAFDSETFETSEEFETSETFEIFETFSAPVPSSSFCGLRWGRGREGGGLVTLLPHPFVTPPR